MSDTEIEDLKQKVDSLEGDVVRLRRLTRARVIRKRSERTIWGLPLYDIAIGPDLEKGEMRGIARGIIAIGDVATGVVAIGGLAAGAFAFGGVAVGLVSFGGTVVGLAVAGGGAAIGSLAIGGAAVGLYAMGGATIAYFS